MQPYLIPKITHKEQETIVFGLDATRALFQLSNNTKAKAKMESGFNRGWDESYQDNYDEGTRVEAFVFGEDDATPAALPNIWPPALIDLHRSNLKKIISLSEGLIKDTLSANDTAISALLARSEIDDLRAKLSFYSSSSNFKKTNKYVVCDAHTDFGLATLNISSDPTWVEVKLDRGSWHRLAVPCYQPILWYGDQTLCIPNALFKPCIHRISYSHECDMQQRFGISVFLDIK